ncbi:MAG: hypothetical protein COV91_04915 [Candidatus Taylorbacteria bacterium CG11_big_fil_rev_8_21_14_0_20_46_11]|uniref:Uncharacterized protein n=1 Tax=Candidatus Taylorbacteria bacterium CG11_big_fil_rev_8_21_14_0_20_46_11 TaxID=1975025 RepID=A0A2H0KAJ1_9BACT|nr:MAG: hypothetical protein COV91_04915 [Candidatus Taylorbacteria bacterium CG11_big_fil_rev_8_21_14_0_20_46_11]
MEETNEVQGKNTQVGDTVVIRPPAQLTVALLKRGIAKITAKTDSSTPSEVPPVPTDDKSSKVLWRSAVL